VIRVRWKPTSEGGREGRIVIGQDLYRCTLIVKGEAFDCRLLVTSRTFELGETYDVPVKFLNPGLVLPELSVRSAVTLGEGKDVGAGEVIELP
jgi:hypothetical protein